MAALTREAILAIDDLKFEKVEVEEWGGSVRVRTMTAAERDAFLAAVVSADSKVDRKSYRTKLLSICVVGEDGLPLFTEAQLGARSTLVVDRLMQVADKLNTVTEEAVQIAEKNSEPGPSASS